MPELATAETDLKCGTSILIRADGGQGATAFLPNFRVAVIIFILSVVSPPCLSNSTVEGEDAQKKLASLNASVGQHPNDPFVYIERAKFWYAYESLRRARADLEQSLKLRPTGAAYVWLGKVAVSPPENKEAMAYFAKARIVGANDFMTMGTLGSAYSSLHSYEKADEAFDAAMKLKPPGPGFDVMITGWKARNLLNAKKFDQALVSANFVINAMPEPELASRVQKEPPDNVKVVKRLAYVDALRTRALCYFGLHDYKQSESALTKAIKFNPHDNVLLNALIATYEKLGKVALAQQTREQIKDDASFLFENAPFSEK